MRVLSALALLTLASCAPPSNIDEGSFARHVDTSACDGDPAFCECVSTAEASGVDSETARQACSP